MEVGATIPQLVHLCCTTEWHTLTLNETLKSRPKTDTTTERGGGEGRAWDYNTLLHDRCLLIAYLILVTKLC